MLPAIAASVSTDGTSREKPSVYLRPIAQPISSRPAANSTAHAMTDPPDRAGPSPRDDGERKVVLPQGDMGHMGLVSNPGNCQIALDCARFPCQTLDSCPTLPLQPNRRPDRRFLMKWRGGGLLRSFPTPTPARPR